MPATITWLLIRVVAELRLLPAGLLLLLALPLLGRPWVLDRRDLGWFMVFTAIDATFFQGLLALSLSQTGAWAGAQY